MTRINADINPKALTDNHLMAEWREIKMVPSALKRALKTKSVGEVLSSVPKKFTLNKGHVCFFYDKMGFLAKRYKLLTEELIARGYNIDTSRQLGDDGLPYVFFRDVSFCKDDRKIICDRIMTRIEEKPHIYRLGSTKINPDQYQKYLGLFI